MMREDFKEYQEEGGRRERGGEGGAFVFCAKFTYLDHNEKKPD